MSRRRRSEQPITLFPFVAVMASTMGALILLLLITARQATKARDAEHTPPARQLPELPPLPGLEPLPTLDPLPPFELPTLVERPLPVLPPIVDPRSAIVARREEIERELADLKKRQSRIPKEGESRLAPLMREAELLKRQVERLIAERTRHQQQSIQQSQVVDELNRQHAKAKQRWREHQNRFAIVPYFGPNSTPRRPIYLECFGDRIVLQPEGVVFPLAMFRDADAFRNPLAKAIQDIGDRWLQENPQAPAYPLLLVRPEGIETYYAARSALEMLRYPFGYELVPAERELTFPPPSEEARQLAKAVVRSALSNRLRSSLANVGGTPAMPNGRDSVPSSVDSGVPWHGRGHPGMLESRSSNVGASDSESNQPSQPREESSMPALGDSVLDVIAVRHGGPRPSMGLGSLSAGVTTLQPRLDRTTLSSPGKPRALLRQEARVAAAPIPPSPRLSDALGQMENTKSFLESPTGLKAQTWNPDLQGLQSPHRTENRVSEAGIKGVWSVGRSPSSALPVPPTLPKNESDDMNSKTCSNLQELREVDWSEIFLAQANAGTAVRTDASHEAPETRALRHLQQSVERSVRVQCGPDFVTVETGKRIAIRDDGDAWVMSHELAVEILGVARNWSPAPNGKRWQPVVLLQARPGGLTTAYRIRAQLASKNIQVRHEWVDAAGQATITLK